MTTAAPDRHADPRTRSAKGWRARLGLLASAGETDGPRVAEAKAALSWWRAREFLVNEFGEERGESLLEVIYPQQTAEAAEAVAR
ncbi:hypothetical protein [Mycolicibacterium brisbanense]|uniref:Uncharacterized protein n=1 Tax=Mycolicibacterium brisbanense TaxID=146020 RepID=A0A100W2K4_9MYCO|nr:hypothetical protein [Mycolicibacterium brisbanense]MCV7158470.1 hypothetical protein [Mycolicibacterium brisbanense]GAS90478.1 uncharacterized protein RMCB_4574 [Mycolicibacterium brisbanense]